MNPPQNINNHFSEPLESVDSTQKKFNAFLLCCKKYTEQEFYTQINCVHIFQLVFFCFMLYETNIFYPLLLPSLAFSLIALIISMVKKNYGTIVHIIYSIFSSLIFFGFTVIFSIVFIEELMDSMNSSKEEGENMFSSLEEHSDKFLMLGFIFMEILVVIWSIQMIYVVFNKRKSNLQNNQTSNGEFPNPEQNSQFNPNNSEYIENA